MQGAGCQVQRAGCYDATLVRIPFRIPARGARPFDVVGVGQNSIDLLAVVAEFPSSNSKQRLQRFARMPGGEIATALVTCARFGWTARYIGSFGDDEFGALSRDSLIDEGVDVSLARTVAGAANRFAIILVDARTGERTILWDRDPRLSMAPDELSTEGVTAGRILIVDCHEPAVAARAARLAHEAGVPTVIDVEKVRPGITDLLQQIDAIIASEDFPAALTGFEDPGRAIAAMAREFGALLTCVTLGDEGSLAWCAGREIRTRPFQVDSVDTTGAGDVFRGAFLAACLRAPTGDVEDVLTYANAAAALSCRALGARAGIPRPEEVEQLLAARPSP